MPNADPVHKVTIIPRGMALGVTQQLPEGDRHNYSQEYLLGQIAILMGGRIAEETFLGSITTELRTTSSVRLSSRARWFASTACLRWVR